MTEREESHAKAAASLIGTCHEFIVPYIAYNPLQYSNKAHTFNIAINVHLIP